MLQNRRRVIGTFLVLAGLAGSLPATDIDWVMNADGNWESVVNWSPRTVPDGGFDVYIGRGPNPQGHTTYLSTDRTVDSVHVSDGSRLSINDNPFNQPDGELATRSATIDGVGSEIEVFANVDGIFQVPAMKLFGSGGMNVTNQATLRMAGGVFQITNPNAMLTNSSIRNDVSGGVHGFGTISLNANVAAGTSVFNNTGRLRASGGTLNVNASVGRLDLDGTNGNGFVSVANNATLVINGVLSDAFDGTAEMGSGSVLDMQDGWLFESAVFDIAPAAGHTATVRGTMSMGSGGNSGNVNVLSGTARFEDDLTLTNGTFNVSTNATLEFAGATNIYKADALSRSGGSVLRISGNTDIVEAGGLATFDWDGSTGLKTEVVGNGKLQINVDYLDTLLLNDFNGQLDLVDNGGVDVITQDNEWSVGSGGKITKKGVGESIMGPSGSPLTTTGSGELAVDSGTLNVQIPVTMTGGKMTVAAGATAEINNLIEFGAASELAIDGTLRWNLPATLKGITDVSGSGKIVNEGNLVVEGDSTIGVATFDWDQGSTYINSGKSLTLNVNRVDTSNDDFNDNTITVDSGALEVNVADDEWRIANGGVLHMTSNTLGVPELKGDRVVVAGTGELRISDGGAGDADADIFAPLTLNEGTQLLVEDFGIVRLLGATTLDGGDINSTATNVTVAQNGPLTVTGDSSINVTTYDWDQNPLTTVQENGKLDLNVQRIDSLGSTFDSNLTINAGGSVNVDLASDEWTLNGTLTMVGQSGLITTLKGDKIKIGDPTTDNEFGEVIIAGSGGAVTLQVDVEYSDHSQLNIGVGTVFDNQRKVDFNGNSPNSLGGGGKLRLSGDVRVNAETYLDMAQLDFVFDPQVTFTAPVNMNFSDTHVRFFGGAVFDGPGRVVGQASSKFAMLHQANIEVPVETAGEIEVGGEFSANDIAAARVDSLYLTADTAAMAFDLGGVAFNLNDRFFVTNETQLDGTLNVSLIDGFEPSVGNTFTIITAEGGFVAGGGQFDSHNLPVLSGGLMFDVVYSSTEVLLQVIMGGISGDFNGDSVYDCADIDQLVAAIASGGNDVAFDLTGDGQVDLGDRDAWLAEAGANNLPAAAAYLIGDANLDGSVDVSDFNIWNANKFTSTAAWCSGDFSADGVVDVSDFNLWNANKFQSADALASVPEPTGWWLGLMAWLYVTRWVRQQQ